MPEPVPTPSTWSTLRAACGRDRPAGAGLLEHRPVAAVLTCSDARVSPARLFDQPEGSLFVVRVAGNIATAESVASLTYAVEHLGVDTVIVLGHSHCGAVTAAVDGSVEPDLACVVDPIRSALVAGTECPDLACAVERNVAATVSTLVDGPGAMAAAVRAGRVAVHGAVLDLETSSVIDISTTATDGTDPAPSSEPFLIPRPDTPPRSTPQ